MRYLGVASSARNLMDRRCIAGEAEPVKAIENGINRGIGGAGAVRILDPQRPPVCFAYR